MKTNALGVKLRQARKEKGLTLERVSELVGVRLNTIWRHEKGEVHPSEPVLKLCAMIYEKPYEWFFGEEPKASPVHQETQSGDSAFQAAPDALDTIVSLDEVRQDLGMRIDRLESYVRSAVGESRTEYAAGGESPMRDPVDVNEVAAAAGGGAVVFDETVVGRLWFRRDWLGRHAIDPKQCNIITVNGESMEPILPSGCSILVDRSQGRRRRRVGRIFVLRTEDGLVVKRAGKDAEGNWRIESEHPAWPPVPWSDTTEIIGEVRWSAVTY